jgi:hypothetical protein
VLVYISVVSNDAGDDFSRWYEHYRDKVVYDGAVAK